MGNPGATGGQLQWAFLGQYGGPEAMVGGWCSGDLRGNRGPAAMGTLWCNGGDPAAMGEPSCIWGGGCCSGGPWCIWGAAAMWGAPGAEQPGCVCVSLQRGAAGTCTPKSLRKPSWGAAGGGFPSLGGRRGSERMMMLPKARPNPASPHGPHGPQESHRREGMRGARGWKSAAGPGGSQRVGGPCPRDGIHPCKGEKPNKNQDAAPQRASPSSVPSPQIPSPQIPSPRQWQRKRGCRGHTVTPPPNAKALPSDKSLSFCRLPSSSSFTGAFRMYIKYFIYILYAHILLINIYFI